jgi:DNA repair exonuclease SbcCD ATPase subunit
MLAVQPVPEGDEEEEDDDTFMKQSAAESDTQPPPTADTDRFRDTAMSGFGGARTGNSDSANVSGADWHIPDLAEMPQAFITGTDLPDEEHHSARTLGILSEAKERAEHQALARTTMLDLVHHIEDLVGKRRVLEAQLKDEQQVSAGLRQEKKDVEQQRDRFKQREAALQERWYKELVPRTEFFRDTVQAVAQRAYPLQVMHPQQNTSDPRPESCRMDYMEVRDYLKLWSGVSKAQKEARERDQRLEALRKEMEEEKRKALAAKDKELAHERAISQNLEIRMQKALTEVKQLESKLQKSEDENERLRREAVEAEARFQDALAALRAQLAEAHQQIADRDRIIAELRQELIDQAEKQRLEKEALESALSKLRAQIKELEMKLAQQIMLLKQMKDLLLRAKREAASAVSPEKFALLIADLEEMRDRLGVLSRESEIERNTAAWLKAKLGQNRRTLELERQFLPLLHKVRGPVGPKNRALEKKAAAENSLPATTAPSSSPDKGLAQSLSTGALGLGGTRGSGNFLG